MKLAATITLATFGALAIGACGEPDDTSSEAAFCEAYDELGAAEPSGSSVPVGLYEALDTAAPDVISDDTGILLDFGREVENVLALPDDQQFDAATALEPLVPEFERAVLAVDEYATTTCAAFEVGS